MAQQCHGGAARASPGARLLGKEALFHKGLWIFSGFHSSVTRGCHDQSVLVLGVRL